MIELEPADDGTSGNGPPATSVATTSRPPMTTAVTAMEPPLPPELTTVGPIDSGEFTTGVPADLPEHCDLFAQDCPPGFKCMPYSNDGGGAWNDTICSPIADNPQQEDEPCTVEGNGVSGVDDCDFGLMCWNVDPETLEGTCVPLCIGDQANPVCPNECESCTISGDGVIVLCLDNCDPIVQNCPPGQACYPVNDDFFCAPDASPPGTGVGSECEFINVCPPGLVCVNSEAVPDCTGFGCCSPICPVGGADPCPGLLPGSECLPWYEGGPPQPEACLSAEPGVCAVP